MPQTATTHQNYEFLSKSIEIEAKINKYPVKSEQERFRRPHGYKTTLGTQKHVQASQKLMAQLDSEGDPEIMLLAIMLA